MFLALLYSLTLQIIYLKFIMIKTFINILFSTFNIHIYMSNEASFVK